MNNIIFNLKVLIRRTIYIGIYILDTFILMKNTKVVIFCYHGVSHDNWRYSVEIETLKKQVKYLKSHFDPITMEDVEAYIQGRKNITRPSFAITFDDGYIDLIQTQSFFKEMGIKPTLFVLSDTHNASRIELETDRSFLNIQQILSLHSDGWLIGSHSATHADFNLLSDENVEREVVQSRNKLQQQLFLPISYFAYPKGRYTQTVLHAVKRAKYSLGLSMNDGEITTQVDPLLIPRIGVDRTHTLLEFRGIFLPTAIRLRKFIKEHIGIII